jgi:hypothetical protein
MTDSMTAFVARFARAIAQELGGTKSPREREAPQVTPALEVVSQGGVVPASKFLEREVIQMDMKTAELLGNGTRIFPDPGTGYESNWYIFKENKVDDDSSEKVFVRSGIILGVSNSEDFVAASYQHILMREVDVTGHQLYSSLIENRQLSRRDVLKALADSDEATDRGIKLVVVPEPSSWLGAIGEDQPIPCVVEKHEG